MLAVIYQHTPATGGIRPPCSRTNVSNMLLQRLQQRKRAGMRSFHPTLNEPVTAGGKLHACVNAAAGAAGCVNIGIAPAMHSAKRRFIHRNTHHVRTLCEQVRDKRFIIIVDVRIRIPVYCC